MVSSCDEAALTGQVVRKEVRLRFQYQASGYWAPSAIKSVPENTT
jgi:hypothetical protein